MSKKISLSEARQMVRQWLEELRAGVMRDLPDALKECDAKCAKRISAEIERRLDEIISSGELKIMESLHRQAETDAHHLEA